MSPVSPPPFFKNGNLGDQPYPNLTWNNIKEEIETCWVIGGSSVYQEALKSPGNILYSNISILKFVVCRREKEVI